MAARAKDGVDTAKAQSVVENTVKNADPSKFPSLSPASAGSLTTKVRAKAHFFKNTLFQATHFPGEHATIRPGGSNSATTTMMSIVVSFVIFMMH